MKRILSIVLCLVLALGLAAIAETATEEKINIGSLEVNGEFILKASIADGYTIIPFDSDPWMSIWFISSEDVNKPVMSLVIAYDEAYADIFRINDMTEEQLKNLEATWNEYEVEISYPETAYGTKLLQAVEVGDYTDFVTFFAIYEGYCIEFNLIANPEGEVQNLTQEQIDMAIKFLSDLDFVPIEN